MAQEKDLNKIEQAFKEIGHREVRVNLKDGVIVSLPAQQVLLSNRNGVKIVAVIETPITK